MEMEFVRHEPCYDRILFVLTLDRKKMKERILIGEELQVRFRLQGDMDADVLCDITRPLGTFLAEFEHDTDGEWNRFGLAPLREALHSNRWKQPALEQAAGEFLKAKFDTGDPLRMYVAFRIWNGYLLAREPAKRAEACDRFMDKMSHFTMTFQQGSPLRFDNETGKLLWSSIFVTLMANKIGGLQFGIYRNCQISSRVFHTAVAALPLTKANRSDFE